MTHTLARTVVSILASARITRLVYQDVIGERVLIGKIRAMQEHQNERVAKAARLVVEAADCPHCAGFWTTMATTLVATRKTDLSWPARLGLGVASSYVVGHVVAHLDSPGDTMNQQIADATVPGEEQLIEQTGWADVPDETPDGNPVSQSTDWTAPEPEDAA